MRTRDTAMVCLGGQGLAVMGLEQHEHATARGMAVLMEGHRSSSAGVVDVELEAVQQEYKQAKPSLCM
ncbi:hypothetical protein L211DRAFT_841983 [Terfezia boudieri ATCC MYA-4762]|uniref:Uncharacterized protein n=1 Tax=Terfezia boudieri ATCC MYA-4762 TaxID=1051890 RepID=A0A3N4LB93_9PEZI|nr:hypothetical protein L211DRAFT_841983 [Terfezia boudieri ATCC MYA-4762]